MTKIKSNFGFRLMAYGYKFRDFFSPRTAILKEAGIKLGYHVLDYGCGSGSYIVPTVKLTGYDGKVYIQDIHPLAIKQGVRIASKKQLTNIVPIHFDCKTGLHDKSIDVVLLYDVFHLLDDPDSVLKELHRILKTQGILSFSDHHMKKENILSMVTKKGLFSLSKKGKYTYGFEPQQK